jgi:hypothetical protein
MHYGSGNGKPEPKWRCILSFVLLILVFAIILPFVAPSNLDGMEEKRYVAKHNR